MARLQTEAKNILRSTRQKSAMSKEELKSVCNLLLAEGSLTAEPRPRMEKQNLKGLWRDLINFCPTLNLHMSHRKKEFYF